MHTISKDDRTMAHSIWSKFAMNEALFEVPTERECRSILALQVSRDAQIMDVAGGDKKLMNCHLVPIDRWDTSATWEIVRLTPLCEDHAGQRNLDWPQQTDSGNPKEAMRDTGVPIITEPPVAALRSGKAAATGNTTRKQPLAERQFELRMRQTNADTKDAAPGNRQEPYTVKEAARLWGQSMKATRLHFKKVIGARVHTSPARHIGGRKKRRYQTVLIPPDVLEREIRDQTVKT
jgi:hypothetical protein